MCPYNNRLQKSSTENLPQMICRADKPTNEKQKKNLAPAKCMISRHLLSTTFFLHPFLPMIEVT